VSGQRLRVTSRRAACGSSTRPSASCGVEIVVGDHDRPDREAIPLSKNIQGAEPVLPPAPGTWCRTSTRRRSSRQSVRWGREVPRPGSRTARSNSRRMMTGRNVSRRIEPLDSPRCPNVQALPRGMRGFDPQRFCRRGANRQPSGSGWQTVTSIRASPALARRFPSRMLYLPAVDACTPSRVGNAALRARR
jgi:hypothetical protein